MTSLPTTSSGGRGETTEINEYVSDYALRILKSAAEMHDCSLDIKVMGAAESIISDTDLCEHVGKIAEQLGMKVSSNLLLKLGGSEDFSYMSNRVQSHGGKAAFVRVRSAITGVAHGRTYNFDESYITKVVKLFCAMAYDLMK